MTTSNIQAGARTWSFDVGRYTVQVVAKSGLTAASIIDADGKLAGMYVGPTSEQDALRSAGHLTRQWIGAQVAGVTTF
jgi:hypothetical protein